MEWWGIAIQKSIWPNSVNSGCFQSNSIVKSISSFIRQLYSDSFPVVCLFRQYGIIYRPSGYSQMPDRIEKVALAKVDC